MFKPKPKKQNQTDKPPLAIRIRELRLECEALLDAEAERQRPSGVPVSAIRKILTAKHHDVFDAAWHYWKLKETKTMARGDGKFNKPVKLTEGKPLEDAKKGKEIMDALDDNDAATFRGGRENRDVNGR
jgi:hypothetical protein